MPYDIPLQEQYKNRIMLSGTFSATGTLGSMSQACKEIIITTASDSYVNFGTTAGANVANSLYLPGDSVQPLFSVGSSYITICPVSGTVYASIIGYY